MYNFYAEENLLQANEVGDGHGYGCSDFRGPERGGCSITKVELGYTTLLENSIALMESIITVSS